MPSKIYYHFFGFGNIKYEIVFFTPFYKSVHLFNIIAIKTIAGVGAQTI